MHNNSQIKGNLKRVIINYALKGDDIKTSYGKDTGVYFACFKILQEKTVNSIYLKWEWETLNTTVVKYINLGNVEHIALNTQQT